MVQGVYLGNFMHDFRHAAPSATNVPIANSYGHANGTVYEVQLMDQYGQAVPVTNIASHYGHVIGSDYDADGTYFADDGKFTIHVGCEDFNGKFLYFSFTHQGEMEANGWYSYVSESMEELDCPEVVNWESAPSQETAAVAGGASYGSSENPYAMTESTDGNREAKPNKPKKPTKAKKPKKERAYDYYNGTADTDDSDYNYSY